MAFRIGKIPVRVLPSFFLMTAILGLSDPTRLFAWIAVVFASVIVHELGHAVMGLAFGLQPTIVLHAAGGTTSWTTPRKLSMGQGIAVSLAGPLAGFAFGTAVFAASALSGFPGHTRGPAGALAAFVVSALLYVNFRWGLLNLLPMLPLDGGNVMAQVLGAIRPGRGERPARIISIVLAVAATAAALAVGYLWLAFLAGSFVLTNWRGVQQLTAIEHDAPLRQSLEGAYAALEAKDASRILALARPVALQSRTGPVRAEAMQLVAFGFLLENRLADADAAIAAIPSGFAPHASLVELRERVAKQAAT